MSVYVNLDPGEFATGRARSIEIRSLLDEADRMVRHRDQLSADERSALRKDMARLHQFFQSEFSAHVKGAHGLAVFCCGPADLFEAIRLPRAVDPAVVIDSTPFIEPLAVMGPADRWCVALVTRRNGRILCGTAGWLGEVVSLTDDVHGWHDQGGFSQARFQRGIQKEATDHVKHVCEALFRNFQRAPFRRLVMATPDELWPTVESHLHPYLKERLLGRIELDIEHASADEIHAAAMPLIEEDERRHERETLDRLTQAVGRRGRGAHGLEDVLDALTQRRVETLLVAGGFRAPGVVCPQEGYLGPPGGRCPVEGHTVENRDDIVESAVESAVAQSAEVIVVRHYDDLGPLGSIGAVLRF
jgi:peptide subunit release factor 1 (eRF1)